LTYAAVAVVVVVVVVVAAAAAAVLPIAQLSPSSVTLIAILFF